MSEEPGEIYQSEKVSLRSTEESMGTMKLHPLKYPIKTLKDHNELEMDKNLKIN